MKVSDEKEFLEEINQQLRAGATFHFRNKLFSTLFFALGGIFLFLAFSAAFTDVLLKVGYDPTSSIMNVTCLPTGIGLVVIGMFAFNAFIEISPDKVRWKVIGQAQQLNYSDLAEIYLLRTEIYGEYGGHIKDIYSCVVRTKAGETRKFSFAQLKKDRPMPPKKPFDEFVMAIIGHYLLQSGIPNSWFPEHQFKTKTKVMVGKNSMTIKTVASKFTFGNIFQVLPADLIETYLG